VKLKDMIAEALLTGNSIVLYNKEGELVGCYGARMGESMLTQALEYAQAHNPTYTFSLLAASPGGLIVEREKRSGN
jgi:hypothetical protein